MLERKVNGLLPIVFWRTHFAHTDLLTLLNNGTQNRTAEHPFGVIKRTWHGEGANIAGRGPLTPGPGGRLLLMIAKVLGSLPGGIQREKEKNKSILEHFVEGGI